MLDVDAVRAQIPLTESCSYFNTGGIAPVPTPVADALRGDIDAMTQRGPELIMDYARYAERLQSARACLATFLGVEAADLCLTHGVADGVTTVFNGIDWAAGDELILTDEEHPAVKIPAERLIDSHGVVLKFMGVDGSDDDILGRLDELLSQRTRLLALSHVTTDTGTKLPAQRIVARAHDNRVPVLWDGAQSLGQFPVDCADVGADFYSLLVYKWMYGPYTAGALHVTPEWQDRLRVVPSSANYFGKEGARRFEFSTVPPIFYHAAAAAVDWLEELGVDNIEAHSSELARQLRSDLRDNVAGLHIENPAYPGMCTGIVTFRVDDVEGAHISTALRERGIITRPTGLKFSGVRTSVAAFTTQADCSAFVEAVGQIVDTAKGS